MALYGSEFYNSCKCFFFHSKGGKEFCHEFYWTIENKKKRVCHKFYWMIENKTESVQTATPA
jgi:hypothetical protein